MTDYFKSTPLELPEQPMDVSARGNLAAIATIDGGVSLVKIDEVVGGSDSGNSASVRTWQAHAASCRSTLFLDTAIVSGDSEGGILLSDIETCKRVGAIAKDGEGDSESGSGEEADCGTSCMLALDERNIFAVGYDDGLIRLYDTRCLNGGRGSSSGGPVAEFSTHTDFVSDMDLADSGNQFVTASGDGTLALFDVRRSKKIARSEDDADDEMLSLKIVKGGKKVVCGHQSGVLGIYSWGYWNDCSDRFPGHPGSVDTFVKVDDDTLLTGSSDGLIRIVGILPNKALGIVGEHLADYPVEKLCLEQETLLSISHNNVVKFWSVAELFESDDEDEGGASDDEGDDSDDDNNSDDSDGPSRKKQKKGKSKEKKKQVFQSSKQAERSAFFADR